MRAPHLRRYPARAEQAQLQLKPLRLASIQLYAPALHGPDERHTGVAAIDSVEAAIHASIARRHDAAIAFIPEGPYVVPHVAS